MFLWATLEKNIPFLLNFVFTIVIARLVSPEAYGLMAMTAILTALARVLQNLGFGSALVQRKVLDPADSTTAFVVNSALGAVLAVGLVLAAGSIARFFGHDEIVLVVQANALALFLAALGTVQTAMLQREYRFRAGLVIEVAAMLVSGVVALVAALRGADLWALLLMMVVREGVRTLLLWLMIRWRPAGGFSMVALRGLWGVGRHMIGASLYHQLATNLTGLLLGKFYPPAMLGFYGRAQSLQILPVSLITQPLQRVAFPLYSRNQDNRPEVLRLLRMHGRVVALLAGVITAGLVTSAGEIVLILVGDAWTETVPMLRILGLAAFFNITFPLHSEANKALGESRWFFRVEIVKKTVLVALVLAGVVAGITWLLWALVLSSVTDYALSALSSRRFLGYGWRMQLADIGPALGLTVLAVTLALLVEPFDAVAGTPVPALLLQFGLKGVLVLAVFGAGLALVGRRAFPEVHARAGGVAAALLRRARRA